MFWGFFVFVFFVRYIFQQRALLDQPPSLTVVMTISFVWNSYIKHFWLAWYFISDVFVDDAVWQLKIHCMVSARKQVENIHFQPPTCPQVYAVFLFKWRQLLMFSSSTIRDVCIEANKQLLNVFLLMDHHWIQI